MMRNSDRAMQINTHWCQVSVRRTSRQKSMALQVKEGVVHVSVPYWTPERDIRRVIEGKKNWIEKALVEQNKASQATSKRLFSGESFLFRGKTVSLVLKNSSTLSIHLDETDQLILAAPAGMPRQKQFEQLQFWYRQQATECLTERTFFYGHKLNLVPASVSVRSYRARWGCCSAKGVIKYNWRLIMAPMKVIDYVVIHELCHLVEANHSSRFWQLVANSDPQFQQHRQWLKHHGNYLDFQLVKA